MANSLNTGRPVNLYDLKNEVNELRKQRLMFSVQEISVLRGVSGVVRARYCDLKSVSDWFGDIMPYLGNYSPELFYKSSLKSLQSFLIFSLLKKNEKNIKIR